MARIFVRFLARLAYLFVYSIIAFTLFYVPLSFYMILTGRLFGWTEIPSPILVVEEICTGQLFTWWRPDVPRFLLDSFLLLIECFGFIFSVYLFSMIAGTLKSHSASTNRESYAEMRTRPFVSLMIPTKNESMEIVLETLNGAINQKYPDDLREILLIDNGDDQALSTQLRQECKNRGVRYLYFENVRGIKASVLNFGLSQARGEFVAVLDADQIPVPTLLQKLVTGFDSPDVAYTVAKVRFRNIRGIVSRASSLIHLQFYEVIEVAKSRRGMTLFAGTSGCFRKDLLMEIGGFQEETLIEDIDTSTALLSRGYKGKLVNQIGSWGLAPTTCCQQIAQLWRWAHGATAILRLRTRAILRSSIPWTKKIEMLLDVSAFLAGLATFFFTLGTAVMFIDNSRPFRPRVGSFPLYLVMPTLVIIGHLGETFLSLIVDEHGSQFHRRVFELPPFYLLSFAIFPFLISAVMGGFFGRGRSSNRRSPWNPEINFRRNALLVFTIGMFLLTSGIIAVLRYDYGVALLFIAMSLCCIVPLPLCGFEKGSDNQEIKLGHS